jgi:hypothetical protein
MRVISMSITLHWIITVSNGVRVDQQITFCVQANAYFTFVKHKRIVKFMYIYSVIFINILIVAYVLNSKFGETLL